MPAKCNSVRIFARFLFLRTEKKVILTLISMLPQLSRLLHTYQPPHVSSEHVYSPLQHLWPPLGPAAQRGTQQQSCTALQAPGSQVKPSSLPAPQCRRTKNPRACAQASRVSLSLPRGTCPLMKWREDAQSPKCLRATQVRHRAPLRDAQASSHHRTVSNLKY